MVNKSDFPLTNKVKFIVNDSENRLAFYAFEIKRLSDEVWRRRAKWAATVGKEASDKAKELYQEAEAELAQITKERDLYKTL